MGSWLDQVDVWRVMRSYLDQADVWSCHEELAG